MFLYQNMRDENSYTHGGYCPQVSAGGGERFHCEHFPDSLACQYMLATRQSGDWGVLSSLVRAYDASVTPPPNTVVVHLRVGDVLDLDPCPIPYTSGGGKVGNDWSVRAFLQDELEARMQVAIEQYLMPLSLYEARIEQLPASITHAALVGASHLDIPGGFPRSSEYIDGLRDLFRAKGLEVTLELGHEPDRDFVYMARAAYFMQGGGGFSYLVAGAVHQMGGSVICYQWEQWRGSGFHQCWD